MEDFSLPYRPLNISPDEDDSNSNYASLDMRAVILKGDYKVRRSSETSSYVHAPANAPSRWLWKIDRTPRFRNPPTPS